MRINKHDTQGTKPLLGKGELGYDDYTAGGDVGRVYVGTGTENIALAEKLEVDSHVSKVDNPHSVTKAQVGLGNVDNTADANKNVLSATKWTTARTITLSGDVTGSVSMDGTANVSITTTVQPNSVALGTDTTGNYVAGVTAGTGITVSGTAGEGWSPTVAITNVGTAGTYTKVTTNAQGQVTSGTSLAATDIPNLDASKITTGIIDAARLPAYVDDVLEFANLASFPATGEAGKIYVALDTNKTYRWSGSVYIYITSGAVDSVNGQTGVVNITTITGNAGTATKLQTARTINGVSFDGSSNITITDSTKQPLDNDLTAIAALSGTSGFLKKTATDTWTLDTSTYVTSSGVTSVTGTAPIVSSGGTTPAISISAATTSSAGSMSAADKTKLDAISGTNTGDQTITLTGDVTGSGTRSFAATLANSGVTAGTYTKVTTDAKGRVTSGTTLSASDIPTLNQSTTGSAATLTTARTVQTNLGSTASASFNGSADITPGVTGTLPVSNGGTGATTLTGLVKGNGTSAMSVAVAGTDYVIPSGSITGNASTATTLQTARTISGVSFNGSANIDIEDRLGTAIASAATTTIGTRGLGDYIHITGTTTITSFGTAAAAGVRRTLIFDGALTLTHNATSLICPGAANIVTVAGTIIEVVAETTANWRVVSITHPSLSMAELNYLDGVTSAIQTQLNAKAALDSPALTGTPTAPTAAVGTSTTQIASTAFVNAEIANDAVLKVISTDNAIVRFNGTTGDVQNSSITIDDLGNLGNGTQTFNGFGGTGFKNYIINGNFDVWQRGTSFTGLTNGFYSADRWVVYDAVGDINYNVIRNAGVFNTGYGATYTWNSGTGQRSIIQFIENVTRFKVGSSMTVSFEAYTNSTPYSINVALQAVRGVWASSTAIVASPIALTNTKTKYSVTLSVPDWSSIGIDWAHLEDTKLALKFDFGANTNGRNFIVGSVQLEEGSVATPFEQRPYGLELSLCQYFIRPIYVAVQNQASTTSGQNTTQNLYFPSMRTTPTVINKSTTYAGAINASGVASVTKNSIQYEFYYGSLNALGSGQRTDLLSAEL